MEFFIIENGQQVGPLTISQLAEKRIKPETLVWREGMEDWQPAWKVNELRYILKENCNTYSSFNDQATYRPSIPPIPENYREHSYQQRNLSQEQFQQQENNPKFNQERFNQESFGKGNQQTPKKSKTQYKILGGVALLLLIILVASNPSKETHENAIRTEVSKAIDKATSSSSSDLFTQGFRMMARMMAGSFIDNTLNQLFEYHNYLLFSKGTITLDSKEHTVSYGVLGKVITMNADDLEKALEKDSQSTNYLLKESENPDNADNSTDVNEGDDESQNSSDAYTQTDNSDEANTDIQSKIEEKANKAVDKIVDHASKKVEEKINKKIDEVSSDSTAIEKLIDKILDLF